MTSTIWVVSSITPIDLPAILAIENQSPSPWTLSQLEGEFFCAHGVQLVCRRPGSVRVAGFIMGRAVSDEAEILKINTNLEDRHQGVACCLINEFIELIKEKGARKCHLELRADNAPARHLYEKFDFLVTGLRKNYYTDPNDDALCMSLSLF